MDDPGYQEETAHGKKGKMIAVCGAKGGIGKTVLAINLAIALHKKGSRTAIWDGDFQFGDVDIYMDLQPSFSIDDVVEGIDSLDPVSLQNFMAQHDSGVVVLPSAKRPEYADLITPAVIAKTGEILLDQYDALIVDAGTGLNDQSLSLLEQADEILLATTPELASMKSAKLMLDTLQTLKLRDRVQVVVNRSTMESAAPVEKIVATLGIKTAFYIPNNFSAVARSLDGGIPLVLKRSKSNVGKAILKMAAGMETGREIEEGNSKKGFAKMFKKGGDE